MFSRYLVCSIICLFCVLAFTFSAQAQDVEEDIVGFVKVETTNLYTKADEKSVVLEALKKGQLVLVIDQNTKPDWWKVFSSNGKEGWVKTTDVGIAADDPITYREYAVKLDPVVRVVNSTRLLVTLTIGGTTHKIPSGKEKTLTFKPGGYPYSARATGIPTAAGTKFFQAGQFYTWKFSIKTKVVKVKRRN